MKKCVVIPDSFKGSLDAISICEIAKACIQTILPGCETIAVPVADGGEGTVECFLHALGGERVETAVHGPFGEELTAAYARIGAIAVIEMSATAGLPLAGARRNPSLTTTYGVGEQLRHAVEHGARELILGLGGSATNDCACGCAAALGAVFRDEAGEAFVPTGGTLSRVASIDLSDARRLLKGCSVTVMCDIKNPMHGPEGAAHIYAPQKGADEQMVLTLDAQLAMFDGIIQRVLGIGSVASIPGAGAAGAMGAGMLAFFGARLKPGIETVLDLVGFDQMLEGADLVLTGEGKIDVQSLSGKVVAGVARRAKQKGVPVIAVVGDVGDDAYGAYEAGVSAIFSINRVAVPRDIAKTRSREDFRHTLEDILRLIKALEGKGTDL